MARTSEATVRRRRGLPRAEQVARNRADLLAAAGQVFRELGYSGASLDAIADAAGFSKGAVYSHFTSKADLFLSLLESRIEDRARAQREAADALDGGTPLTFIERIFAASRADPQWRLAVLEFRVVAARDTELRDRYARLHQRTLAGVVDALGRFLDSLGTAPDLPVETLAIAGLIFDAGVFLEELASASLSAEESAVLFGRLLGLQLGA
jgi:AcrR family transcriptional regulator